MSGTMPSTALEHVRHLATTIGPRGSTTPSERAAAVYARERLSSAGLETHWEPFRAPVSGWRPFAIAAAAGLASLSLPVAFGRTGASLAAVLMTIVTVSVFLEMYFRPNALRPFVAKGDSQNVWARVPARAAPRRRIAVVAHIDTHRTPWVFTRPWRLTLLRLVTSSGVVGFVVGSLSFALIALSGATSWSPWTLLLAPIYLAVLAVALQPDLTPHTVGANDNASGVAIVLSLAERLAREPLEHVEVWALVTGCEEVGSYGAQAFVRHHRDELAGLAAISIDNVAGAGAGPCYTSVEGMVLPLHPDANLFASAEAVRHAHPELGAYTLPYTTLHTDATAFMAAGVPSLSFVGLTPDGVIPHWHQASDRLEHVSADALERTERFVAALLERVDREAGAVHADGDGARRTAA